ncbi:hypothetical protein [Lysinibacillus xylanilyticus]|uniref:Uncharacterized protein n=1 Tax=Lysinibacillus xylanilyticus TaxID=582475 RepID=A0A2M9QA28_9BACI|nr:hypothetical protein [Lysinibacillus xylanilyticus]PJO44920.1 hypothetical protein CWD94_04335 [Lysinibacillus xylanilyticus]
MTKIDITSVRDEIDDAMKYIQKAKVLPFFKEFGDFSSTLKDHKRNITTFKITDIDSLLKVPMQRGFYIIFSNIEHKKKNNSKAVFDDKTTIKAIYRGEAYNVQDRLKSHLFNKLYIKEFKGTNFLKTTLMIDGLKVNVDLKPHSKYEWYVVYIAAPDSIQIVREMYEDSFDQVFVKPPYSNDRKRKGRVK